MGHTPELTIAHDNKSYVVGTAVKMFGLVKTRYNNLAEQFLVCLVFIILLPA
jgi:hypothetical protein